MSIPSKNTESSYQMGTANLTRKLDFTTSGEDVFYVAFGVSCSVVGLAMTVWMLCHLTCLSRTSVQSTALLVLQVNFLCSGIFLQVVLLPILVASLSTGGELISENVHLCNVHGICYQACTGVASITLLTLAIERYLVVVKHHSRSTNETLFFLTGVTVSWTLPLLLLAFPALGSSALLNYNHSHRMCLLTVGPFDILYIGSMVCAPLLMAAVFQSIALASILRSRNHTTPLSLYPGPEQNVEEDLRQTMVIWISVTVCLVLFLPWPVARCFTAGMPLPTNMATSMLLMLRSLSWLPYCLHGPVYFFIVTTKRQSIPEGKNAAVQIRMRLPTATREHLSETMRYHRESASSLTYGNRNSGTSSTLGLSRGESSSCPARRRSSECSSSITGNGMVPQDRTGEIIGSERFCLTSWENNNESPVMFYVPSQLDTYMSHPEEQLPQQLPTILESESEWSVRTSAASLSKRGSCASTAKAADSQSDDLRMSGRSTPKVNSVVELSLSYSSSSSESTTSFPGNAIVPLLLRHKEDAITESSSEMDRLSLASAEHELNCRDVEDMSDSDISLTSKLVNTPMLPSDKRLPKTLVDHQVSLLNSVNMDEGWV